MVGNRPQFIKAAAVSGLLRERSQELLVHTGQHHEDALSDVFFRELGPVDKESGPRGAAGVALMPGLSIAVDRRYVPLGAPVWIETTAPYPDGERPLHELLVAQDTGGAIKGVVRGDVFWGAGEHAEDVAGHMKSRGRWLILLPRAIAPVS